MSDDKNGSLAAEAFYRLHYCLFGFVVKGAGCFVEDDYVGLFVEGSGYADTLALAAGETDATFANEGFVFFRPGFDNIGYFCLLSCFFDSIEIDINNPLSKE